MLHTYAIVFHATCAVAAFIVGMILIFERSLPRQLQLARVLLALLALMGVFLVAAILSHLSILPTVKQIVFGVLFALLLYMIWRAVQAVTALTSAQQGYELKVVDHVGFVLISLFDGFAIVSAIDLRAPGWLVAVIAVAAVVVGVWGLNLRKTALGLQPA